MPKRSGVCFFILSSCYFLTSAGLGLEQEADLYGSAPVDTQQDKGLWSPGVYLPIGEPLSRKASGCGTLFGWTYCTLVPYYEFQEDAAFSSEAELQE